MELVVKTPTFPEVIEFNYEECKKYITERASIYAGLVYSPETMKDAKKDRANLNKFVDALSKERIKIKKECLKPYAEFEAKIKELDSIVQQAIENIDGQIKEDEERKRQEKKAAIISFWFSLDRPEGVLFEQIFCNKWLNASIPISTVEKEIEAKLKQIKTELATLGNLPEFAFEAKEEYMNTLNFTQAVNEAHRLSEIAKRKAEAETKPGKVENKATAEPTREAVCFRAYLTYDDARALNEFFKSRGIPFESIEGVKR